METYAFCASVSSGTTAPGAGSAITISERAAETAASDSRITIAFMISDLQGYGTPMKPVEPHRSSKRDFSAS